MPWYKEEQKFSQFIEGEPGVKTYFPNGGLEVLRRKREEDSPFRMTYSSNVSMDCDKLQIVTDEHVALLLEKMNSYFDRRLRTKGVRIKILSTLVELESDDPTSPVPSPGVYLVCTVEFKALLKAKPKR